jgi:serine protease Do
MIVIRRSVVALAIMAGMALSWSAAAAAIGPDFTQLVDQSMPAVVNIETRQFGSRSPQAPSGRSVPDEVPELFRHFFESPWGEGPRQQPDRRGGGSGFIIDADGLVVTNHHVIDGADEIVVRLADRREFEAELVGSDPETDVAVLRIAATGLPTLTLGDSDDLRPGEWVIAIGSPFQFEQSVTAGIVSAKGRSQMQQQYVPFIQSDVAINRGNSGGPLIRTDGSVVGINSWILSSHGGNIGLSFSIPIEVARHSVEQLLEFGQVSRGFLGVNIEGINREKADALGLDRPAGALVTRVEPDSAAALAGIEVGDVIVRFNQRSIDVFSELPPLVGLVPPGAEVPVDIVRWGERLTVQATIQQRDEGEPVAAVEPPVESSDGNVLGLAVESIDSEMRQRLGNPEGGVVITAVESEQAHRQGIRRGQVILMINNQPIAGMDDFNRIAEGLALGRPVALLLHRADGSTTFAAYTPVAEE